MTSSSEQPVIDYLQGLHDLEPDPAQIDAIKLARTGTARRRRRRRSVRNVVLLSVAIAAGSSALATATGLWTSNPDPIPPARVVDSSVPPAITAVISSFDRPQEARDRNAAARAAIQGLRSPFVIDGGSVREAMTTPLGEQAYVAFARTDLDALPPQLRQHEPPGGTQGVYVAVSGRYGGVGADGPFPLVDIERGRAWGIKEVPPGVSSQLSSKRVFTAVVPSEVADVELEFRGGARATYPAESNVVLAPIEDGPGADAIDAISWIGLDGRVLRTFRF